MKKCPKCGSNYIVAIEYDYLDKEHYDGISEYKCLNCGYRQGRWSGQELKDGYIESVYNKKGIIKNL